MSNTAEEFMEALTRDEPLHPDLVPYLRSEDGGKFVFLQHPLVYSVPFISNAYANKIYAMKYGQLAEAQDAGDHMQTVMLYERPYRLDCLMKIDADGMTDAEYWSILGHIWTDTENVWELTPIWKRAFKKHGGTPQQMMNAEEWEAYDALPEKIDVYRGAQMGLNHYGMSWTTDYDKALWFARRFNPDKWSVVVGRVRKSDVAAYFTRRGESEVVIDSPATSVEIWDYRHPDD